jgi:hypothetical protein
MPTTPNMNLELPDEDGSANVWDTILALVFGENGGGIDGHDHTTGKGVPIPSAALRINADVACAYGGTSYALTALKAVDFTPHAAADVASYSGALFVSSADNNLYFRNTTGTNVKITDGTTLNVSIVGGIGGDYSAVEALLDYDDASDTYRARQELDTGVRQYGKMAHADLLLYEYDAAGDATVPTNAVTLKSPDALAAGYSVTFPAAVPASTVAVQMSSAGVLTASNTLVDYGNSTERYLNISAGSAQTTATGPTLAANGNGWSLLTSTGRLIYPIDLHYGDTLQSYQLAIVKTSGAGTINARLYKYDFATATETALGAGTSQTITTTGLLLQETGLAIAINDTSEFYYLVLTGGGTTGDAAYHALISYTRTV